jgi:hypothetical protein
MKHFPGVIWALRPPDRSPNGYVKTLEDGGFLIKIDGQPPIRLPRADARLLAKRIAEALEATRS